MFDAFPGAAEPDTCQLPPLQTTTEWRKVSARQPGVNAEPKMFFIGFCCKNIVHRCREAKQEDHSSATRTFERLSEDAEGQGYLRLQ